MKRFYLLLLLTAISITSFAQTTAASYAFSRTTGTYTSISSTGTRINTGGTDGIGIEDDDGTVTGIPIGFTFKFCGTNYTTLSACSNGWLSLAGSTSTVNTPNNSSIPGAGFLFPFWFDLDTSAINNTRAYYQTTGTAGSRVFTIEFNNFSNWVTPPPLPIDNINFQVKLFEGTNIVQFVYGTVAISPTAAGIGIANSTSDYQYLSSTTATLTSTSGFSFASCSLPAANTILQFCPNAPVPTGNTPVCVGSNITLSDPAAGTWTSSNTAVATVGSGTGVVTGVSGGTATITLTPSGCNLPVTTVVTVNALPGLPSGNTPVCAGANVTLTNAAGAGTWSSGNTAIATIGSSSGIVTGVAAGTASITYTATSTGCTNTSGVVTVNAQPSAITGSFNTCPGTASTLTSATTGGTWASSNSSLATIGSVSGLLTGVSAGNPTISYTALGCTTTQVITVNSLPSAIASPVALCPGQTATLTDATPGGTWSSSNTALATVGSSTGVVTAISTAGGTPLISYTAPTGCSATMTVTVNAMAPISGTLGTCTIGFTTTLVDATPSGVWTSSNPSVASIGSSSGIVTTSSAGSTTINYFVASTGCSASAVFGVTGTPNVYTVTGGGSYCSGGTGVTVGLSGSDNFVSYQLYNGSLPVGSPVSGGGSSITFAPVTAASTYTVVANPGTSCATNMSGSAIVSINPLPTVFSVTGGGSYCSGGTGVHVGLSSSTIGVNYQLYNGSTAIGAPVAGTSAALDFGLQTTSGTYTVVATNATTGCVNNMTGSATITINPLPTVFSVTGGGGYCTGGSGMSVGLSGSQSGVNYQLYLAGAPVGSALSGSGSTLNFGNQTTPGTYTVIATNATTSCVSTMTGSVGVTVNPLPSVFTVTGGGAYCSGTAGVHIGLNSSTSGINYQLFRGTTAVGSPLAGSGSSLDFGLFTTAGSYTIVATNATTGCTSNMSGSASVTINPLPVLFAVTGGGSYCAGGVGVHVGLASSEPGITYQLYNGTTLWDASTGTGSAIDFGLEPAAGTYTIVATNGLTGCTSNMTGSAIVTIKPLPTVFTVTGGGSYCSGGTGVHIGLSGSSTGVNYQLYNGASTSGSAIAGTGIALDFGLKTSAGSYTVVATNATTGCTSIMSGSSSISINPLPPAFTITGTGGYCAGTSGTHLGLSGSLTGYSYQLNIASTLSGSPVAGTGFPIDFGLRTVPGSYTVVATNTATGCFTTMTGSVTVSVNPLPTAYFVTGGGAYCAGTSGVHIGLSNSAANVKYRLFNGTTPVGSFVAGTGAAIDFGLQTATGTYTVVATDTGTLCTNNMSGSVSVSINSLPAAFAVTGGGGYCTGGTGVHVGLAASTSGISYQLYNGTTATGLAVSGTGGALDFGAQTAAGNYTVIATNTATSCTSTMTGTTTVSINPLPAAYLVTGGGNYCFGATGVAVGLANSATGVNYQLMLGTSPVGAPTAGTGAALNFGLQTAVGIYSVVATNLATACTNNMSGTKTVGISPLPVLQSVTGGGNYCPGGTGVDVGLASSQSGVNYQLYNGATAVGSAHAGTGSFIDFGLQTASGTYTVKATDASTACTNVMTGSATVGTYALPVVYNVTGTGNYCPSGSGVAVGLSGSDAGISYQLYNTFGAVGLPVMGTGLSISFGSQLAGTYTVVATSTITTCINNMNGSAVINISPLPAAHIVTGGGTYCAGGTGVHVGLNGSDTGIRYQLYMGTSAIGTPLSGTGAAIDFGTQTAAGNYTVVALSSSTTCSSNMTGSAIVGINALPATFTVIGGGNYCVGGTGVHVKLNGSTSGILYQLYRGTTAVGTAHTGTGVTIDFGLQTTAGTYTVVATNPASGCVNNMTGSVNVVVNALPIAYTTSGGGSYCTGGAGEHIMLSGSNTGVNYQLYLGASATGSPVAGTGFGIDLGAQTASGVYTVKATDATSGCVNNMTGSAGISINPLPHVYSVSSTTSNYCIGGSGVDISLTSSDTGINYQLYLGTVPVGGPVAGSGSVIDFGYQLSAGTYTVVATNAATTCTNNMASSVTVVIDALPTPYTVTGGGGYCTGTTGTHIGLSSSNAGLTYQLYVDGLPAGAAVTGTGSALDFGLQSTTGTYSVIATNALTTCTNNMSNTVSVSVNPLPAVYAMTGGGSYCAGGSGVHVGLGGSAIGVRYQLYNGATASGAAVTGTGASLDLGAATAAGTYTIVGTDPATGCSSNMLGSEVVSVNPLPTAYPVIGGGNYCPGSAGVHVGINGSHAGVSYQLFNGITPVGGPMTGSGPAIDFGYQTATGTYTVVGTDASTGCVATMSGSAVVGLNPLPASFNVTGGGSFCSGTAGAHVGLNGSQSGVSYQLRDGVVAIGSPVAGTGGILDFGPQTLTTTYTVVATNTSTTCVANMAGTATVTSIPTVTPIVNIVHPSGDTLCAGNFTTFTAVPVNGGSTPVYQWSVNSVPVSTSSVYGYIPIDGDVLTVSMTSSAACASPSSTAKTLTLHVENTGTPAVAIAAYPGNTVCQGTTVNFAATPALGGSAPSYTWIVNTANVGGSSNYSYTPSNGDDIYVVMNSNYHCRLADQAISAHIHMTVDVATTPTVTVTSSAGTNIAPGQTVVFTANVTGAGSGFTYQWSVNSLPVPGATNQTFTANTLNDMDVVSCEVSGSGACTGVTGSGSATVHVNVGVQQVTSANGDIKLVPNPNKGAFMIKGSLGTTADEDATVEITDMLGQVVYTGNIKAHNGDINERIQLSSVANGMYIITLHSATGNTVFHMVVEQ